MPLFAPSTTAPHDPAPAGNHVARCVGLIHIGTIPLTWEGVTKPTNRVWLTFELPTELKEFREGDGEKPYLISQEYTLSFHENATLRKHLENWRGKAFSDDELATFDIEKLVGKPCMLNVMHNEKGYAKIAGVTPIPKGLKVPDQVNPTRVLLYDSWNQEVFESLPEFLQEKIRSSQEYQEMNGAQPAQSEGGEVNIDEIPF